VKKDGQNKTADASTRYQDSGLPLGVEFLVDVRSDIQNVFEQPYFGYFVIVETRREKLEGDDRSMRDANGMKKAILILMNFIAILRETTCFTLEMPSLHICVNMPFLRYCVTIENAFERKRKKNEVLVLLILSRDAIGTICTINCFESCQEKTKKGQQYLEVNEHST
jgi:hypothetical protein